MAAICLRIERGRWVRRVDVGALLGELLALMPRT
jgi:hypothetical protein